MRRSNHHNDVQKRLNEVLFALQTFVISFSVKDWESLLQQEPGKLHGKFWPRLGATAWRAVQENCFSVLWAEKIEYLSPEGITFDLMHRCWTREPFQEEQNIQIRKYLLSGVNMTLWANENTPLFWSKVRQLETHLWDLSENWNMLTQWKSPADCKWKVVGLHRSSSIICLKVNVNCKIMLHIECLVKWEQWSLMA